MLRRDEIVSPTPLTANEQEIFDRVVESRDEWSAPDLDLAASYAIAFARLRTIERLDPPVSGRTHNEYLASVRQLADLLRITPKVRHERMKPTQPEDTSEVDKMALHGGNAPPSGTFSAPWHQKATN
jgi:hypothetical protein